MGVRLTIRAIHPDGTRATSQLELDQARIAFGRAASSDVLLPHASVSQLHATLQVRGAGYVLVDESSTNGTFIAGTRLVAARGRTVRSGEVVQIGPFEIELALGVATAGTGADATAAGRRLLPHAARTFEVRNGPGAGTVATLPEEGTALVVGRAEDAFLRVDDAECSRVHAFLDVDAESVVVRDAESKNGVVVNGRSTGRRVLRDGDELTLGATRVGFVDPRDRELVEVSRVSVDVPADPPVPAVAEVTDVPEPSPATAGPRAGLEIVEVADAPSEPSPSEPVAPRERTPFSADAFTDQLAFGLALVVLVLSIVGFVWLFGDSP